MECHRPSRLRATQYESAGAVEALSRVPAAWVLLALFSWVFVPSTALARVVIIGVDGGSWNLIDPLVKNGKLPHIAKLMATGTSASLESHEPVNSPSVWTTIATGRPPRDHGVTDFHATRLTVAVPTAFERLAYAGRRVGLYDYLVTWPPERFEGGFVIPGWLRHDQKTIPEDTWERIDLEPYVQSYANETSFDQIRERSLEETRLKGSRFVALSEAFELDVGAVTFYALDSVAHRFWRAAFPEDFEGEAILEAPYAPEQRDTIALVLRGIDEAIGEIAASLGDDDTLLIVSDHGFERSPDGVDDIWIPRIDELLAEAGLDPERDGFHVVTAFGVLILFVHEGPFEARDAVLDRLLELVDSVRDPEGEPLFSTDFVDLVPRPKGKQRPWTRRLRQWGLKIVAENWFHLNTDRNGHAYIFARPRENPIQELWPSGEVSVLGVARPVKAVFRHDEFTGDHRMQGILLARGPAIAVPARDDGKKRSRPELSVLDIAPLLFYTSGTAIPDDLVGHLPEELLRPEYLAKHPPRSTKASTLPPAKHFLDEEDIGANPDLVEMLRRLGYVR